MVSDSPLRREAHAAARELRGDGKVAFMNKVRTRGHAALGLQQACAGAGCPS